MDSSIISITNKLRDMLADNLLLCSDVFTYTTSKIFNLSESNVSSATILVYKNGTLWANTNYSFNSTNGKLTVTGTLASGDSLEVTYNAYVKYSDTELAGYIRSAFIYLSTEKYKVFKDRTGIVFPTPTEDEENLTALIASIIIKPAMTSYKTPEISINFADKESKDDKIRRAIMVFKKSYGDLQYHDIDAEKYSEMEDE